MRDRQFRRFAAGISGIANVLRAGSLMVTARGVGVGALWTACGGWIRAIRYSLALPTPIVHRSIGLYKQRYQAEWHRSGAQPKKSPTTWGWTRDLTQGVRVAVLGLLWRARRRRACLRAYDGSLPTSQNYRLQ
jgi:hypothetical protein